jgi:hypothetical protein
MFSQDPIPLVCPFVRVKNNPIPSPLLGEKVPVRADEGPKKSIGVAGKMVALIASACQP